jgi:hypothetical protein
MSLSPHQKNRLLLRRQFILGPRFVEELPGWKKIKINSSLFMTIHPELETAQASFSGNSINLLGYILDPYEPQASNLERCDRLLRQINSADDVFSYLEPMCGRFIIILSFNGKLRIFTDAIGYRSIYYAKDASGSLWCASQPGSIAEQFGMESQKDMWEEFLNSYFFKHYPEYWYPGDSSPYRNIFHLLPKSLFRSFYKRNCKILAKDRTGIHTYSGMCRTSF